MFIEGDVKNVDSYDHIYTSFSLKVHIMISVVRCISLVMKKEWKNKLTEMSVLSGVRVLVQLERDPHQYGLKGKTLPEANSDLGCSVE